MEACYTDSDDDFFDSPAHSDFDRAEVDPRSLSDAEEPARFNRQQLPERVGNFVLLSSLKLDRTEIRVAKWRSEKSGLAVIYADNPDLISTFSTTVVTEIFESSGVPHTKEHLTFMASKHYPYSDFMDRIASRLMTAGVNAATDVDNTTYTAESASQDGLLQLVPVYLDHILFPKFSESTFKTEIYHVNGKGEEGGTVFAEMQGREGSREDVMALAQQQALYNFQNAYRYETGGMLPYLRKLSLKQITDYHNSAYVPQNMTVVVTGRQIDPVRLLETISRTTERDISAAGLARGTHPRGWVRPFVESSTAEYDPIIEKDKTILVPYADSDTTTGEIQLSFVGPRLRDSLATTALGILGDYLAGSAHAVLNRKFVEIATPACSDISFDVAIRDPTILSVTFSSVKASRLSTLANDFKLVLKQLCRESIDMGAMRLVIRQQIIGWEKTLETNPSTYVKASALQDIIYGDTEGRSFKSVFNDLALLQNLMRWNERDWLELFEEYLVTRHSVVLIGTPDPSLVQENASKDAGRVAKNIRQFGPRGLAKLDEALKRAEGENHQPPPPSLLQKFAVPDFRRISWLAVYTARSNGVGRGRELFHGHTQAIINADGGDLPLFVQFDHVPSNFVSISVFVRGESRPILPLYIDTFFSMPIDLPNGRRLGWQKVSRKIDEDLISARISVEHEGLYISLTAVRENYAIAVGWLSDFLYGTVFDVARLENLVNTKLDLFPSIKQDASGLASAAIESLTFSETSFETPTNPIAEFEYYPKLKNQLDSDPQSVVDELEQLRRSFLDVRNMRFSVVGNVSQIERPSSTWRERFDGPDSRCLGELAPLPRPRDFLTSLGRSPSRQAVVYGIANSESQYVTTLAACPDANDPAFAALHLSCSILSQTNGLLWNATRTAGLCSGASITPAPESGFIALTIYRAPDAIAALAAIHELLSSIKSRNVVLEQADLEAGKSQLAYEIVEGESTHSKAAHASFFDNVVLGRPRGYCKRFLSQIERVTISDVYHAIDAWIEPLVDSQSSILGATTSPAKMAKLVGSLHELVYDVEQRHF
ncbi:hypothetical protein JCM3766R1_002672 [Sporobolomyces carnicolor]